MCTSITFLHVLFKTEQVQTQTLEGGAVWGLQFKRLLLEGSGEAKCVSVVDFGWCGVVWCGVVWCGVVWCGVVWCGVVWCCVVWLWAVQPEQLVCSDSRSCWTFCRPPGVGRKCAFRNCRNLLVVTQGWEPPAPRIVFRRAGVAGQIRRAAGPHQTYTVRYVQCDLMMQMATEATLIQVRPVKGPGIERPEHARYVNMGKEARHACIINEARVCEQLVSLATVRQLNRVTRPPQYT